MKPLSGLKGLVGYFKRTVEKANRNFDELREPTETLEEVIAKLPPINRKLQRLLLSRDKTNPHTRGPGCNCRCTNDRIQTLEDEYAELENTNDALRAQLILNTAPKPTKVIPAAGITTSTNQGYTAGRYYTPTNQGYSGGPGKPPTNPPMPISGVTKLTKKGNTHETT